MSKKSITDALSFIDPSALDYTEWVSVGMALKHEGFDVDVFDDWSKKDSARYHEGECEKKWNSFNEQVGAIVTGGTIINLAEQYGYEPFNGNEILDWDSVISGDVKDPQKVIDQSWLEDASIKPPEVWDPVKEITTYLETLFDQEDYIGFVTDSWKKEDEKTGLEKYFPTTGQYTRTAGEIIRELEECNGDIGKVLGDYNPNAGAWVRFNPLDGQGVGNSNVKEYRYALVESDHLSIGKQAAIMKELHLPIATLVYSGNKSIHAIVRIDADSYTEYKKRVEYLYKICEKNGLNPDTQNKNPSRLSRLPGFIRGDKKQFLINTNIGEKNFEEWKEYIESVNDDLPEPTDLANVWDNMPELSPCLIENVLRKGHKMLLAGPSKAGKSFLLIELAIAIAEGKKWLEWQCAQGRVLYVNLEVDSASCFHRFKKEYEAMGLDPKNIGNIDIWNLRGKSAPLDKLAPKLIRRAKKKNYEAVIIDPIYKVITGDENSASDMALFCNQFDKICSELNCAVIYCHHHSKGAQGNKKSADRASGSGVFARDPDAMLDMIELVIDKETRTQAANALDADRDQEMQLSAWRIETTLREFPSSQPIDCFFSYPLHTVDDWGILKTSYADGDIRQAQKVRATAQGKKAQEELVSAIENANFGDPPTFAQVVEYTGKQKGTISKQIKKYGYEIRDGKVYKKKS